MWKYVNECKVRAETVEEVQLDNEQSIELIKDIEKICVYIYWGKLEE